MKKLIFVLLALVALSTLTKAEVTSSPFISISPNLDINKSPNRQTYQQNLIIAVDNGLAQLGPIGQIGSFTLSGTDQAVVDYRYHIATPYNSFGAKVGTKEYGGHLVRGFALSAHEGNKLVPQSITFNQISTGPKGTKKIIFSGLSSFTPALVGVEAREGIKTYLTKELIRPVSKLIIYVPWGIGVNPDATGTPEEIHTSVLGQWKNPFELDLSLTFSGWEVSPDGQSNMVEITSSTYVYATTIPTLQTQITPTGISLSWEEGSGEVLESLSCLDGGEETLIHSYSYEERVVCDGIVTVTIPLSEVSLPQQFFRLRITQPSDWLKRKQ